VLPFLMMEKKPKSYNTLLKYSGLATQWLVMLGLAVWGGIKLDSYFVNSFPLLTILLPLLAICLALWKLIKDVSNSKK
jgi:hypothetical protein